MSDVFNLGGVLGALNPADLVTHYYNQSLANELNNQATQNVANTFKQNQGTATQYANAAKSAFQGIQNLAPSDLATISGLIQRGANYDPLNVYNQIRTGNLAALSGLANTLGNVGKRQQSLNLAGLGYGGGAGDAYQNILNQSRVNSAIAPIAGSIFSNLGADTSTLNNAALGNLGATLNAISQRAQIPTRGLDILAAPTLLRGDILNQYLSGLGSVGQTSRNNVAGFEYKDKPWVGALKAADTSLNSALDTYLSMYGGGMGGGAGGGGGGGFGSMFGGGGGGGAGGAKSAATGTAAGPSGANAWSWGSPQVYSNPQSAMYAGGAGGYYPSNALDYYSAVASGGYPYAY